MNRLNWTTTRWAEISFVALLVWMSGLLLGCTIVVKEPPPPGPLYGKTTFYLEALDFSGVEDPEEEHVQSISEMYLAEMKNESSGFTLKDGPTQDAVTVRARVTKLDKGISMGLDSTDSSVEISVQWLEGEKVLESKKFEASVDQSQSKKVFGVPTGGYSDGARLTEATEKVAEQVMSFMHQATRG